MVIITDKHDAVNRIPKILALNQFGDPLGWINYQKTAYYYFKDKILWSIGKEKIILRGGINAVTHQQSTLELDTIVAIDGFKKNGKTGYGKSGPKLTNKTLFARDKNICAYCGRYFIDSELTRDHILPKSKNGSDSWVNCVTCCKRCNNIKGDRTPEEAGLTLLYVPYSPCYNEHLILQNRVILEDQMEYLLSKIKNKRN